MIAKLKLENLKAIIEEMMAEGVEYVNTKEDIRNNKLILMALPNKEEGPKENKEITAA